MEIDYSKVIEFGSICFNGKAQDYDARYKEGCEISFGDTTSQKKPVRWIRYNGGFLCWDDICRGASWDDLNENGLIYGRPFTIDGVPYICRSLSVGFDEDTCEDEWSKIMDAVNDNNNILHWSGSYFWGQERHSNTEGISERVVRRLSNSQTFNSFPSNHRAQTIGFRPVLERVKPQPFLTESLFRQPLVVYGPKASVAGILVDWNDYDIILSNAAQEEEPDWMARLSHDLLALDRSRIYCWQRF